MSTFDAVVLAFCTLGVVVILLRGPIALLATRAVAAVMGRASARQTLRLTWLLSALPGEGWAQYLRIWRARALKDLGSTADALELVETLLAGLPRDECPWWAVNQAVDLFVSAGLYRRALAVSELWSKDARVRGRKRYEVFCAITRINQAEALHNLGYDDAALARLESVSTAAAQSPLAANGLRCLRAWILVHRGELIAAREELSRVAPDALTAYRAEVQYTWAALERELGNLEGALWHAETGLQHAKSASSRRNGMFLVAGILALRGDDTRATALFNDAVSSDYRGQGGDGLLRFADFLSLRGRSEEAARMLELVLERDPESVFAERARETLRRRESGALESGITRMEGK